MRNYFDKETLMVNVSKSENNVHVRISSDYAQSNHKGRLYVNPTNLERDVKVIWDIAKGSTTKINGLSAYFGEIDYYDNMTDVYYTPTVRFTKGKRVSQMGEREHGSIPKDWEFVLSATFSPLKSSTPIIQFVTEAIGRFMSKEDIARLTKDVKSCLSNKKSNDVYFELVQYAD